MIALIDSYDSFTWNLYQILAGLGCSVRVIRNDQMSAEEVLALQPEALVLSPGPGRPEDAGILLELIESARRKIPILGICLGHQAICQSAGAPVIHASRLMHGKQDTAFLEPGCPLFEGLHERMQVGRYHSLAADPQKIPSSLRILCHSADGEIMGVQYGEDPVYGIQFHPESILTPKGQHLLSNFLNIVEEYHRD